MQNFTIATSHLANWVRVLQLWLFLIVVTLYLSPFIFKVPGSINCNLMSRPIFDFRPLKVALCVTMRHHILKSEFKFCIFNCFLKQRLVTHNMTLYLIIALSILSLKHFLLHVLESLQTSNSPVLQSPPVWVIVVTVVVVSPRPGWVRTGSSIFSLPVGSASISSKPEPSICF